MDAQYATHCPLCGAAAKQLHVLAKHPLCVCSQCRVGFLWPQPDDAELAAAYAAEYYGADGQKFRAPFERMMSLSARRVARELAHGLPAECRAVLDVGCGRGLLINALLDSGIAVHGFERSREATRGIDARATVSLGVRLADAALPAASFGAIVWRHVLEHVRDPVAELAESLRLLHPRGSLLVEVPHFGSAQARFGGAAWFHLDPPRHLFHFTEGALRSLLERSGFAVAHVGRRSLAQDTLGWVQSALHMVGRPRDGFFEVLKQHKPSVAGPRGLALGSRAGLRSRVDALIDAMAGTALVPAALAASIVDARSGGGGTLLMRGVPRAGGAP